MRRDGFSFLSLFLIKLTDYNFTRLVVVFFDFVYLLGCSAIVSHTILLLLFFFGSFLFLFFMKNR